MPVHTSFSYQRQYAVVQKQTAVTSYYESTLLLLFAEL